MIAPSQVWRYVTISESTRPRGPILAILGAHPRGAVLGPARGSELLDALHEDAARLISEREESPFEDLPLRLLVRGLEALGERLEPSRLYNWLSTVGRCQPDLADRGACAPRPGLVGGSPRDPESCVPNLAQEARLERLRTAVLALQLRCTRAGFQPTSRSGASIRPSRLATRSRLSQGHCSVEAHESLQDPSTGDGLTLDVLRERTRGRGTLAQHVDELCRKRSADPRPTAYLKEPRCAPSSKHADKQRQQREEWASHSSLTRDRIAGEQILAPEPEHPGQEPISALSRALTEWPPLAAASPSSSVATAVSSTRSLPACGKP